MEARLDEHDAVLEQLPELETLLTSQIDQHEAALASAKQLLDAHDGILAGLPAAIADFGQLKEGVVSRFEQQNGLIHGLQTASSEQRSVLESVAGSVSAVQAQMQAFERS